MMIGKTSVSETNFRRIVFGVLAAAGLLVYSNTFQAEFTFDGRRGIAENRAIRELGNISEYCSGPKLSRCLTYLSFALNYQVHGYHVQGYHAVNLALHIGNAGLLFLLLLALFKTPALESFDRTAPPWIAALAALLFLVHPVQTQAVTYVWQRSTLLGTFFYLLTVYFYVTGRVSSSRPRILGSILCLLAGTVSKEIIFTAPLTLLLCETGLLRAENKPDRRFLWAWACFAAALLIIPLKLASNQEMKFYLNPQFYNGRFSAVGWDYLFTQINVVRTYLRLLIIPYPLNLDYYYPVSTRFFEWKTVLSFLMEISLFSAGLFSFQNKERVKLAGFGILWFFITLSVESTLVPLRDLIFEHRLYLPSAGFAIALSSLAWPVLKKSNGLKLCAAVILGVFCILTFQRNFIWRNDFTLWTDTSLKAPANPRPHQLLGAAHVREAERFRRLGLPVEALENYEAALSYYENALALGADKSEIHANSGAIYEKLDRMDAAREVLGKALEENPQNITALYNSGVLLLREGKYDQALSYFEQTVARDSKHADAYNNAGSIHDMQGRREKAFEYLTRAVKMAPEHFFAYHNLGYHFMEQEKWTEAAANFTSAIRHNSRYFPSYLELAKIYLRQNKEKEFSDLLRGLLSRGETEMAAKLDELGMLSFMSMSTGTPARKGDHEIQGQ